nr:hypothetical protein [Tanacetum cinerariifolium]
MSNPTTESSVASLVKVEAPSDLSLVSLVKASHKKPKFHLAKFDKVVKIRTTHDALTEDKSCDTQNALAIPKYIESYDLKAQLQDKDTTISKLKEIIKSLRENNKEENVNHDTSGRETKNELENSVVELLSDNERLRKEINHVK